jgi:glycosyltransferase involved in cell wall biosynthesis
VLIPCFNARPFIRDTLDSVLEQTWPKLEIIVVDDGSTDGSAETVAEFGDRVTLIRQANRGQTAALNVALDHCHGDFIQYLDADDLISRNKIAAQMARLAGAPGAIASAEWGRFYRTPDEARFVAESVWRDMAPIDWLIESRRGGLGMMFPALWLIPRGLVEVAGPWREDLTLNNDAEYFTRVLLAANRVLFCERARCYYRSGLSGSLSGRKSSCAWRSQFSVLDLCEAYILAREDSDRSRRGLALSWQHFAHGCYPYDASLSEAALGRARRLHAVSIRPDGGPTFRALTRVMGWRAARRLQVASGRP